MTKRESDKIQEEIFSREINVHDLKVQRHNSLNKIVANMAIKLEEEKIASLKKEKEDGNSDTNN